MVGRFAGHKDAFDAHEIIIEAQRLREYVLRLGKPDVSTLVDGLLPFETKDGAEPDLAQREALYLAFQDTKNKLSGVVDDYTINRVLAGRSPYEAGKRWIRWVPRLLRNLGVTGLGALLVGLTLFYTVWSNTAADLILRVEEFAEFDHRGEIMRLVEIADAAGIDLDEDLTPAALAQPGPEAKKTGSVDPQTVLAYEMVGRLSRHYLEQNYLNEDLRAHVNAFPIHRELLDRIRKSNCERPVRVNDPETGALWKLESPSHGWFGHTLVDGLLTCPDYQQFLNQRTPTAQVQAPSGTESAHRQDFTLNLFNAVDNINGLVEDEIYEITGRNDRMRGWPYSDAVKVMEQLATELGNQIGIVHRWLLPIFYGMMGSVLYCLWRILNPPTAPLDFLVTFMRTAFAGLAALTLSMLILPANVLSLPFESTRPIIYLIAFLFGYSIETFVDYLNALNRWLNARIRSKTDEDGDQEGSQGSRGAGKTPPPTGSGATPNPSASPKTPEATR